MIYQWFGAIIIGSFFISISMKITSVKRQWISIILMIFALNTLLTLLQNRRFNSALTHLENTNT